MSGVFASGEFSIPNCAANVRSVCVFNQQLHVFGGSGGGLTDSVFNLPLLADQHGGGGLNDLNTDALRDPSKWQTNTICNSPIVGVSAVSTDEALWVFYTTARSGLLGPYPKVGVMKYALDGSTSSQWANITTDFLDGLPLGAISATVLGQFILVACMVDDGEGGGRVMLSGWDSSDVRSQWGPSFNAEFFLVAPVQPGAPSIVRYFDLSSASVSNLTFQNIGSTVSIDWFSTVGTASDGKSGNQEYYLALSFTPQGASDPKADQASLTTFFPLNVSSDGDRLDLSLARIPDPLYCYYSENGGTESCLMRDSGGRLKSYVYRSKVNDSAPYSRYYRTARPPSQQTMLAPGDSNTPLMLQDNRVPPAGTFYIFLQGSSQTTINGVAATQYPVLEFIFSGVDTQGQVNLYGEIQVLQKTVNPQPAKGKLIYTVSGIIDGPIPLPIENFKGNTLVKANWGALTYGTKAGTNTDRQVSNSWTVGFESSGETTDGIGPAWDISLSGGMGQVTGSSGGVSLGYSLPQTAEFDAAKGEISPYGTLQTVSVAMSVSAFRFVDANGTVVSDATSAVPGSAPKVAATLTNYKDNSATSYTPFAVKPGNLRSYTAEAWNRKMGKDYYRNTICANAYPFQGQSNPYITFTWTEGIGTVASFTQFTESYTESSWKFELGGYVGVSGGVGFEIFGLGEKLEAKFLVGATYNHESTSAENQEWEWGIEMDPDWGPPMSDDPGSVKRYEFRLFFLPVPKPPSSLSPDHWVQELIAHLKNDPDTPSDSIDPQSCCWKIVYVVTAIEYRNSKLNYPYDPSLEGPSVYEVTGTQTGGSAGAARKSATKSIRHRKRNTVRR